MVLERNLIGAPATPPEPMPVASLVDGDPVNPRPEARLAAEAMNRAKHAQEHFLGHVERFVAVVEQVDGQLHDHPLVLADELRAGDLVPGCTPLHERRFALTDVRPTRDADLLHAIGPQAPLAPTIAI